MDGRWVIGERGAVGDEADTADDEENAEPSREADVLVLPEVSEQSDDDVAEGGGGKDEGEVGPGERGEVAGEEAEQAKDAGYDPNIREGVQEQSQVRERDGAYLGHAVRKEGVADRGSEDDREQDQVAGWGEGVSHGARCG